MQSRIKLVKYITISTAILAFLIPLFAIGRPNRPSLLPDRGRIFGCATCHINPAGGGPRNSFGNDWLAIAIPRGDIYVPEIANRDSDGDGFTNDQEFNEGTNPGDPDSYPLIFLTINASAGQNGSIFPSGEVVVRHGANQEFTITPDEGFQIEDVIVDGNSALADVADGKYIFENVTSDRTIEVTFVAVLFPAMSISPTDYDFGEVKVGDSSDALILTISNTGTADLSILGMSLSNTTNYDLSDLGTCGSTIPLIPPGGNCTIDFIFKPVSVDAHTANLIITSDDPDNPIVSITLSGTGIGIKGDVNADGKIRSNDAILALQMSVDLVDPSDYEQWAADMNDDGRIKSNDAIVILRIAAGLAVP